MFGAPTRARAFANSAGFESAAVRPIAPAKVCGAGAGQFCARVVEARSIELKSRRRVSIFLMVYHALNKHKAID